MSKKAKGIGSNRRTALVAAALAIVLGTVGTTAAMAVDNSLDNATMDSVVTYAQTYFTADDDSLMGTHRAIGITCVNCHPVSDGTAPEAENASGKRAVCMTCHSNWEDIEAATGDWAGKVTVYNPTGIYNPHSNHRGDADCGDCHKMHSEQTLTCAQCHDVTVPEGWLGYY